ncbi:ATP-grasp domain-containing protein [Methanoregula formicica]|uniref:Putative ATP-utilizing enzyme (ATP-grasp superfamily) n=1 Tax=Methanoregula formicica (strain DSM 22288 / NBRC 105244 / SMSP) TaxID=593750 RepID=L0HFV0_METFS|nr:ATP-grasp domain-containing protein [Methanoregula formicica]AGB02900.1 putative ATP-utilizing enzyme (ATP-grasp superfamily) [Methanoregula formicica SMSP]
MKVLLAEYTVAHEPALAHEGAAMLSVLKSSFERCGHGVVLPGPGDFGEEIARLAPGCDMGLVIAPDHLLSKYTFLLEQATHNLGCGFMAVALCANKVSSGRILAENGVPVPAVPGSGKRVIKPIKGCGSQGVRLSLDPPPEGEFAQEYIEGENYSVSMVINRVIGDACAYYSGKPPVVLAVNRQEIAVGPDGTFQYLGGETPVHPTREKEIVDTAVKAATVLGCQGYCGVDVVVADKVWVVDVNPRITTSITGIAACMAEEIAGILVSASKGNGPDAVHFNGRARFDCNGKVTRL